MKYLIVDDDAVYREILRETLSPHGECDTAINAHDALPMFRNALDNGDLYDLVCLDINMPGPSGHEVLQAIRDLETERHIFCSDGVRVIMVTSVIDPKHIVQAFRRGCETCIFKPFRKDELLGKICELGLLTGPVTVTRQP